MHLRVIAILCGRTMAPVQGAVECGGSEAERAWTLHAFVENLGARGGAAALAAVQGERLSVLSYADLAKQARALASGLIGAGVRPGEPVALLAPNGFDWVVARLGLAEAGAVAVALDDLAAESELKARLAESNCRHALTVTRHVATLKAIDPGLDLIVMDAAAGESRWPGLLASEPLDLPAPNPVAPAMLVYTSGTTGAAKSFYLTHRNLCGSLAALAGSGLVGSGDRILLPLPLHHVYPFLVGLLTPLACGACVVFPSRPAGPEILQALRAGKITTIVGVPRLFEAMLSGLLERLHRRTIVARAGFRGLLGLAVLMRRRFGLDVGRRLFGRVREAIAPDLRLLVSGGARLRPDVLWPLVGLGFDVRSGYGLAETSAIFTGNLPGATRLESEGRPLNGEVRIAAADERGIGEIEVRGPSVFSEYRNNPKASDASFTRDGWFRTADMGRIDRDGFLFVAGRRSEIIVLGGGKKVDPEELERLYGTSPPIREIAVLERHGTLVGLIVPDFARLRAGSTIQMADAIRVGLAGTSAHLPSFQRIAGFALTRTPLPRTRLGKLQRFRLPALYDAALAGEVRAPAIPPADVSDIELLRVPPARRLYDLLVRRYRDKEVGLDSHLLLDLGIDSLEWVALSLAISERIGTTFDEAELAGAVTVRELLQAAARAGEDVAHGEPAGRRLMARDWIAPPGRGLRAAGAVAYALDWALMHLCFRLRTTGRRNVPESGPYVIVANHASYLDAPLIAAAIGYRRASGVYWGGDAGQLFTRPWQLPLMRAAHVFPVEAQAPSRALVFAERVLARKDALVWFPEGWRSPDGELLRFLPGIGEVLQRVGATVVPLHIAGSFEAMPRGRRIPRLHPIRVVIGAPIAPGALFGDIPPGKDAAQRVADRLHDAVARLRTETGSASS